MVLLEYFKLAKPLVPAILPNENGHFVPFSSIREAKLYITEALQMVGKRKPHLRVSNDERAIIVKYVAEHGIVKAMTHFFLIT